MRAYERLLNYVKIYTTSDENSTATPTTERQFDLARVLVEEMQALGVQGAKVDENCYVYGWIDVYKRQHLECVMTDEK